MEAIKYLIYFSIYILLYFTFILEVIGEYRKYKIWLVIGFILPGIVLIIIPILRKMKKKDDITLVHRVNESQCPEYHAWYFGDTENSMGTKLNSRSCGYGLRNSPKLPLTHPEKSMVYFSLYLSTPSGYQATSHICETLCARQSAALFKKHYISDIMNPPPRRPLSMPGEERGI